MPENRTYQGHTYTRQGPGEPWQRVGPAQGAAQPGPITIGQPDPSRGTRSAADAANAQAGAAVNQATVDAQIRQALAEAELAEVRAREGRVGLQDTVEGQETTETQRTRKSLSDRMKYNNILESIRGARAIAMQGGTGWGSLLSGMPSTQARALESAIAPILGNLSFDRLQEMRTDPDNETGGALGSVTENELRLLGSTVANLDLGVSRDQFLANLNRIERHFVGAQMAMSGIDPTSEQGVQVYQQFGVALPDDMIADAGMANTEQAGLDATTQAEPIPPEMQAEYEALLQGWVQNPDPDAYAQMRAQLDEKYGYEPDYARYRTWAEDEAIPGLRNGRSIGPSLPPTEAPLEGIDWLMNAATAEPTGIGAFTASMGNAGGFGIPTLLAGQDRMEALRGQSPVASLLGEVAGGVTGTLTGGAALGAGARALGGGGKVASLLANPAAADVGYGAVYGATQADDPISGAAAGAGGAWLGNKVGGALAREIPSAFGFGGAVREVEGAVPAIPQLREEADQLYTAARGSGGVVEPTATTNMQQSTRTMLGAEGRVLPDGSLSLGSMPKVKEAVDMLDAYAGQPMTAAQSDAVRKVLADAAGSMDASEARLGTKILKDFDAQVEPFVPGFTQARAVASRYLNAEDIEEAISLADPRSAQYSQSGLENALRTEFRALDRNVIRGTDRFPEEVVSAVQDVSRGTPVSNVARALGRFSPRGVVSTGMGAGVPFYVGNSIGGPVVGGGMAAATMGAGKVGQMASEHLAQRQARIALLLARGGPEFKAAMDSVLDEAGYRGGHIGAGVASPVASALLGLRDN